MKIVLVPVAGSEAGSGSATHRASSGSRMPLKAAESSAASGGHCQAPPPGVSGTALSHAVMITFASSSRVLSVLILAFAIVDPLFSSLATQNRCDRASFLASTHSHLQLYPDEWP